MTTFSQTPASDLGEARHPIRCASGRVEAAMARSRRILHLFADLTKARLSALVLFTTAAGFVMASGNAIEWGVFGLTLLGTALCAASASALNQVWEITLDARMQRTRNRPLPAGNLRPMHAFALAIVMGYSGICVLSFGANLQAAGLALLTVVLYVLAYTPLKTRSTLNTLVGAVCGALPPMIGWAAATGGLHTGAWILAAILFVWQIPHFLALAWLYREDYERGGFAMLPVLDRDGRITTQVVLLTTLLLIPLSLLATLLNVAGAIAAFGALALGCWMLMLALRLHLARSNENARRVFLASIIYLPLLLCLLILDRATAPGPVIWAFAP